LATTVIILATTRCGTNIPILNKPPEFHSFLQGREIAKNKKVSQPVELTGCFPNAFRFVWHYKFHNKHDGISLKNLLDKKKKTTVEKDFAMSQYTKTR
jgi:hypothetical protein